MLPMCRILLTACPRRGTVNVAWPQHVCDKENDACAYQNQNKCVVGRGVALGVCGWSGCVCVCVYVCTRGRVRVEFYVCYSPTPPTLSAPVPFSWPRHTVPGALWGWDWGRRARALA